MALISIRLLDLFPHGNRPGFSAKDPNAQGQVFDLHPISSALSAIVKA